MQMITHTATKYLSSIKMEDSETIDRVIKLGQLLISELGIDNSTDTTQRWMAQYLAELLDAVENSEGEEQEIAKRKCFDTIVKLWLHRAALPPRVKPFREFEKVLKTLEDITPDSPSSYYAYYLDDNDFESEDISKDAKDLLQMVKGIDLTARELIQLHIALAVQQIESDTTKEWLRTVSGIDTSKDIELIRLLSQGPKSVEMDEEQRSEAIANLEQKMNKLEAFAETADLLTKEYRQQIEKLKTNE